MEKNLIHKRLGRKNFIKINVIIFTLGILSIWLDLTYNTPENKSLNDQFYLLIILLFLLLINVGTSIKRLHDINYSGWFTIIYIAIPYAGIPLMIALMCIPGTKGQNKYGMPSIN